MSRILLVTLALGLAGGCGGSIQPRPLQYHFDQQHLASVDPEKQREVVAARGEHDMAVLQRDKAKADLGEIDLELLKARNEVKSEQLAVDSAAAENKAAAATAEAGRKERAAAALELARLKLEAAKARLAHLEARRRAADKELRWNEFNVYSAEAKVELAKAAVAVNNSIAPQGFQYGHYDAQHKQRVAETAQAKAEAEAARRQLEATRRAMEETERALAGAQL